MTVHDTRSTKHNFDYPRVAEFRRVRVKTLVVRRGVQKCHVALTRMQLKQSSFYGSLAQKELPIPELEQIFSMIACAKNGPLDSLFFK